MGSSMPACAAPDRCADRGPHSVAADVGMVRRWIQGLALALLLPGAPALAAEGTETGRFDLRHVDVRLVDDVYRLDAVARLDLSTRAREALAGGVALTFTLEVEVFRQRGWWLDADIATISRDLHLEYHELSGQYVVTNPRTGERRGFHRARSALDFIGRGIDFPVIDAVVITDPARYHGRARMRLRRDALPWALRPAALVFPGWRLQTDWMTWSFD